MKTAIIFGLDNKCSELITKFGNYNCKEGSDNLSLGVYTYHFY